MPFDRSKLIRRVNGTASAVLLGVGAYIAWSCFSLFRAYKKQAVVPLAVVDLDLSQTGARDIQVDADYANGHGFHFTVQGPARSVPEHVATFEPWLTGLEGTLTYVSGPGVGALPVVLMERDISRFLQPNQVAFMYGGEGKHVIRLEVAKPAPALAGVPHKLVVMNDVCGCELMLVPFALALAATSAVAGLGFGAFAFGRMRADRDRASPTAQAASDDE